MAANKRKPARMKPVEAWGYVTPRGRLVTGYQTRRLLVAKPRNSLIGCNVPAGSRIARVRIVEIAAPKKRNRK